MDIEDEERLLRSVVMQNASSILLARQRAERELIAAKEALSDSNERLQLALDAANLGDWNWDAATDQLTLGPRAAQMSGLPAGIPFPRAQMRELLHPENAERVRKAWDQALAERTDYGTEYLVNHPAGGQCWIAMTGRGRYAQDGTVLGMTGMMQNISERKKAEGPLRESEERYRTLFDLGPVAVYSIDTPGVIQKFNRKAAELWGREPALGDTDERFCGSFKLFHPDGSFMPYEQWPMAAVVSGKISAARDAEVLIERPDGSRVTVVLNILPLKNQRGEITGAINCFYDITERKRIESELNEAKTAAEKANLAKSDFLSSMSHELRTPLNGILGFAQLMEIGSPPPTTSQKRSIEQILKAGWYLLELINEILDLALIEAGKLPLSLEPISLNEVVRECQVMIEPQAQKHGIRVTFPRFEIPYFVIADRTRLKQVLINLLSNAIKYNRVDGTVDVAFIARPPACIRICVKDTGAGLTPDKLTQLFQPFNRLGKETGIEEGTGIGLVVSKRLVELMKGEIGVKSTAGVGSVFWIELNLTTEPQPAPAAAEPTAVAQAPVHAGARLRTLLYVEDNPANLMLVEDLIEHRPDIRLLSAADGNRGIEIALASKPDVILMDINLPGISGIQALNILRANPATAHIPVVALSANAIPRDIERGLEAGFFRYLIKPIKVHQFMETLDLALEVAQTMSEARARAGL